MRSQQASYSESQLPAPLKPVEHPHDNPATDAKFELGKRLFFDVGLSSNQRISCATCHDPAQGFSNGQRFAKGVNGEPGTRHVPSLVNVGYATSLFWDGRAATLEEQAIQPIQNPAEMNMPLHRLTDKLNGDDVYRQAFGAHLAGPLHSNESRKHWPHINGRSSRMIRPSIVI